LFGQKSLNKRRVRNPPRYDRLVEHVGAVPGERKLLAHNTDVVDPLDLTIEEKVFRAAKRICIVFATVAIVLSTLDLMNVRTVETAAVYIHEHRHRIAEMPQLIRAGISGIAVAAPSPMVTVRIPRDIEIAIADAPAAVVAKSANPVVMELAAARYQDAVEEAMVAPPVLPPSQGALAAAPPSAQPEPVQLASLGPAILPPATPLVPPIDLPATLAVLPPPAPGVPPPSPAQRLGLEGKERERAERCLANAVYFEARSEPFRGQVGVAQVVLNRVFSPFYPNDVCSVVYQNAHKRLACQFTFACDGQRDVVTEQGAWARARRVAQKTLDGQLYVQAVGTSTHYHATYVRPNWVREMRKMVREGVHNFYRPIAWGSGANLPVWTRAAAAAREKK
jgi:hypothetical protein